MRKRIQGFGCLSVQFRAYSAEGSRVQGLSALKVEDWDWGFGALG